METPQEITNLLGLLYSLEITNRMIACEIIRNSIESGEHDLGYYQQYIPHLDSLSLFSRIYENKKYHADLIRKTSLYYWFEISKSIDSRAKDDLRYYITSSNGKDAYMYFPMEVVMLKSTDSSFTFWKDIKIKNDTPFSFDVEPLYASELEALRCHVNSTGLNKDRSFSWVYWLNKSKTGSIHQYFDLRSPDAVIAMLRCCKELLDTLSEVELIRNNKGREIKILLKLEVYNGHRMGISKNEYSITPQNLTRVQCEELEMISKQLCESIVNFSNNVNVKIMMFEFFPNKMYSELEEFEQEEDIDKEEHFLNDVISYDGVLHNYLPQLFERFKFQK